MRENGMRPQFINLYKCKNILLEGFTINRSPFLAHSSVVVREYHCQKSKDAESWL